MFSFGRTYGVILGVLAALEIPMTLVGPQIWKAAMGVPRGGEKEASRVRVLQLLPQHSELFKLKKHHGRADATLIALYGSNHVRVPR